MANVGNWPFPITFGLFFKESWSSSIHIEISFNLHVNGNLFPYERMSTRTRFEKEAKGNSEMAYYVRLINNCFTIISKARYSVGYKQVDSP